MAEIDPRDHVFIVFAAQLQEGLRQHVPGVIPEEASVHIDPAGEIRVSRREGIGRVPAHGVAGNAHAPGKVDQLAEVLFGVCQGDFIVFHPLGEPIHHIPAVFALVFVEPPGLLLLRAAGLHQLVHGKDAAQHGPVHLPGDPLCGEEGGPVVEFRAHALQGMGHGDHRVSVGGQLDAQEGIPLPVGEIGVVEQDEGEPFPGDGLRADIALRKPRLGVLFEVRRHLEGTLIAPEHVFREGGRLRKALDALLPRRIVHPAGYAAHGPRGQRFFPHVLHRKGEGADGVLPRGLRRTCHPSHTPSRGV